MYRTSDFDYSLPHDLIAEHPLPRRGDSRMLVLDRRTGNRTHARFRDLSTYLRPGDLAVLNNSRVIHARTHSDDGKFEIFFLEPLSPLRWRCLVKPGRKLRSGDSTSVAGIRITVEAVEPTGERIVTLDAPIDLEKHGALPLPPYIQRAPEPADTHRYQTVYAEPPGSVAAPTAGLHFTKELLTNIAHTFVTLHVGTGTFQPVKVEDPAEHVMHSERYEVNSAAATALNTASRILAVGTTSARVLESLPEGSVTAAKGETKLFIRPPHTFHRTHMLLTNFHLPKSSLLMLVCAFGGYDAVMTAYREAIAQRYRFYSYGDCMLIH